MEAIGAHNSDFFSEAHWRPGIHAHAAIGFARHDGFDGSAVGDGLRCALKGTTIAGWTESSHGKELLFYAPSCGYMGA